MRSWVLQNCKFANKQPWQMTQEEWSSYEYPALPGGENTPQAQKVISILRNAGIEPLEVQVRGSHALEMNTPKSDFDIYVRIPEKDFNRADDLMSPLSKEGIDVLLNWKGVGVLGGTLRGIKSHRRIIERAILEGKPVPVHVLADYPDLSFNKTPSKFAQTMNMLGDCRNEVLVESIFGSVSEFARQTEENGDNFVYGNIKIVYDPKTDIHTFYEITVKTYAWVLQNCKFAAESWVPQSVQSPTVLYHVTPYATEILRDGLKENMPETFGGSNQGGMSFTTLENAKNYANGLKWMLKWSKAEISFDYKSPNNIYVLGKEFGVDAIGVQEAISTAISVLGFWTFPDEEMKNKEFNQNFVYEVLKGITRESKGRFPWVFRQGITNMIRAGKTSDDIHILQITFNEPQEATHIGSENEWRITPERVQKAKIEVLAQSQTSFQMGDEDVELFHQLKKLHELWYFINHMSSKMSGRAEEKVEKAKADFYYLAPPVIKKITDRFGVWLYEHADGWWKQYKEYLENYEEYGEKYPFGLKDFPDEFKEYLGEKAGELILKEMKQSGELEEYIKNSESYLAFDFLKAKNIYSHEISDDNTLAMKYIEDNNLLPEFVKFVGGKTNNFSEMFNPYNNYGKEWYKDNPELAIRALQSPEIGELAYKSWKIKWPRYDQVITNVRVAIQRLHDASANLRDVNNTMMAISLALNTAHNSGMMSEHIGISTKELEELSNLETKKWDQGIKHYLHWVHRNCRFAQSIQVIYDDSAIQNSMRKQTEQYRSILEEQAENAAIPIAEGQYEQKLLNATSKMPPDLQNQARITFNGFLSAYKTSNGNQEVINNISDKVSETIHDMLNKSRQDIANWSEIREFYKLLSDFDDHLLSIHREQVPIEQNLIAFQKELQNEYQKGLKEANEIKSKIETFVATLQNPQMRFILKAEPAENYETKSPTYDSPTFQIELISPHTEESMEPNFTLFVSEGKTTIDDVLDWGDTDFFTHDSVKAAYFGLIDYLRTGQLPQEKGKKFITLYRGMSPEEFQKWESGEIIPKGKFFTSQATNQYAQDISGEYPELFRFRVRDDAVNQTSPDTYQIMRDSRLEGKKIVPI